MKTEDNQRIERSLRSALPALTTFLLILAGVVSWPVPYLGALVPSLGLMGVYYWALHRPDLFRPLVVFLFGLLQDSLQGLPLGLSAFLFVCTYQLVLSQRRFFVGQVFLMLWFGFALVAFLNLAAAWGLMWAVTGTRATLYPALFEALFSIVLFPLPAYVLIHAQRVFLAVR